MHVGLHDHVSTYSLFCPSQSPQPRQLDVYIDALERLNASIAFASTAANQRDTVRLYLSPLPFPHLTVGRRGQSKLGPRNSHSCSQRLLP